MTVRQRGSGALVMVLMILLMGTLMLNATRRQLSENLSLMSDERRYIRQYADAVSALAWGERQTWPLNSRWQCRQQQEPWRACLQRDQQGTVLRGDSGPDSLALYRWMSESNAGQLQPTPHGWIDYCPLAAGEICVSQ